MLAAVHVAEESEEENEASRTVTFPQERRGSFDRRHSTLIQSSREK